MANYIGLDIGGGYTKIAELEEKTNIKLSGRAIFKTPYLPKTESVQRQINADSFWQEVAKTISLEKFKTAKIAVNIPSSSITAITLFLPRMNRRELGMAAQTEARRKMIPVSCASHIFESSIIAERIIAKIPRSEVLVVRSDKAYVQEILSLFKNINVFPKVIALSGYTLFTMLPKEILEKKDADSAFIDIGLSSIATSIFREGKLNFFRNTAFGIRDIIQDIAGRLNISEDEAEEIIKTTGIPEVSFNLRDKVALAEEIMRQKYEASLRPSLGQEKKEINLLELRLLWQAHIERIVHELRRSLAYYKEQAEGRRVDYIYFLGGACQIRNLIGLLTEEIGGFWQITLPFKNMDAGSKDAVLDEKDSPIFTNAASLALSIAVKPRGIGAINFLPWELRRKEVIATRRLVLLITKAFLIIMAVLLSLAVFISSRSIKLSLGGVKFELGRVKKITARLKDLSRQEKRIQQGLSGVQEIIKTRQDFHSLLRALTRAIPQEVLINSLSIHKDETKTIALESAAALEGQDAGAGAEPAGEESPSQQFIAKESYRLEIKAEIFADYEKACRIIKNLRAKLESLPYFKDIAVTAINLEEIVPGLNQEGRLTEPKARDFTLTAELR